MRRELHALPMWQECRGNNQTNNRDKSNKHLPLSIPIATPTHSPSQPPQGLDLPRIHGREKELRVWQPKCAAGKGGEGRRSSLKENSGGHNPPLHLAQLRWCWGKSKESFPPPKKNLQEGWRGAREDTMAGWVSGGRWPKIAAVGRTQGFSVPPHIQRGMEAG